jgi:diketogulonate reductase-like aldo/keto reductase
LADSALRVRVTALKRVDLPTLGNPTIPARSITSDPIADRIAGCSEEHWEHPDSRFRPSASARGRRADGCGAGRTTPRASRPSTPPWTTASTGSTRRRSTAPGTRGGRRPGHQEPAGARRPLIFTKFGLGDDSQAPASRSATRADVLRECDASLRRLGVDAIDLYQLHWPAPQPIAETAAACAELLKAGKIRAIGVSNYSVAQLEEWRATGVPLHSVQSPYSILRPAIAADVLPYAAKTSLGVIAYSPLFRGMLFGTWKKGKTFGDGDTRGAHKDYQGARFERHLDAIAAVREIATDGALSTAQLCVGVLLRTPGLTGCIVGARSARQGAMIANLGVAGDRRSGRGGRADHGVAARRPGAAGRGAGRGRAVGALVDRRDDVEASLPLRRDVALPGAWLQALGRHAHRRCRAPCRRAAPARSRAGTVRAARRRRTRTPSPGSSPGLIST